MQVNETGTQVPLQYRYKVTADQKVNAFKPKEIPEGEDKLNLKAAMFGALWCGDYSCVPRLAHCNVVWEAHI